MNSIPQKEGTVCFLQKEGKVLLLLQQYPNGKKVWSGFGGMREQDESLEDCVVREGKEELGFTVKKETLVKKAIIHETTDFTLHVFLASAYDNEPVISEDTIKEIRWFTPQDLPFEEMWPDNSIWMPYLLAGKTIIATVTKDIYHASNFTKKDIQVQEVENLS